jgi:hypothetical protein
MRRTTLAITALVCIAGCGKSSTTHTTSTTTQPARSTAPQYVPGAHHAQRPPGSVYDDEIGENITTATRDRVMQLFGPPASKHGACIDYRIVGQPKQQWEFCFKGQKMSSAMAVRGA